jgi:hypothetical protein
VSAYLLVKYKGQSKGAGQGKAVRMPLPVSVGTSPFAHIIVNSQALLPVSYEIAVDGDQTSRLRITALKDGSLVEQHELGRLGLQIKGPFLSGTVGQKAWRQRLAECLVLEQQWFDRLPEKARRWLGARLPQSGRLGAWAAAAAVSAVLLTFAASSGDRILDYSATPQMLQAGVLNRNLYGASATRLGYEKGVLFRVGGLQSGRRTQLRFDIGGLDEDREIEVLLNGTAVYASKADVKCVESFCSRTVLLPEAEGEADIFFRHNGAGTYLIKNVLVQEVMPLTPAEVATVNRWLESARRAWADRSVSAENIVFASEQIGKAEELASARSDGQQLLTEIQVLKQEVSSSFAEIVSDMTFKVRKDLKLGAVEEARKNLQLMLRLYPDPAHPEHRRLKNLLKETEGMQ